MLLTELSDPVLTEIFKYLRNKDIPVIRRVCRNWAKIVSDSSALRRKYALIVKSTALHELHPFVLTFMNSPYRIASKITFVNVVFDLSASTLELWEKIGGDLERLSVKLYKDNSITESYEHHWITLLERAINLKVLHIEFWTMTNTLYPMDRYPELQNLKKLEEIAMQCYNTILSTNILWALLRFAKSLISIQLESEGEEEEIVLCQLVASQEKTLKVLRIVDSCEKEYILKYIMLSEWPQSRALAFGKSRKMILELAGGVPRKRVPLPMRTFTTKSPQVMGFPSPSSLETLTTTALDGFNKNFSNMRNLMINHFCCDHRNMSTIIENLVHLEILEVKVKKLCSNVQQISLSSINNLKKLKHLRIKNYLHLCDDSFFETKEPLLELKTMSLDTKYMVQTITDVGIKNLINYCPKLEKLILFHTANITDAAFDGITSKLNLLRELYVCGPLISTQQMYQIQNVILRR